MVLDLFNCSHRETWHVHYTGLAMCIFPLVDKDFACLGLELGSIDDQAVISDALCEPHVLDVGLVFRYFAEVIYLYSFGMERFILSRDCACVSKKVRRDTAERGPPTSTEKSQVLQLGLKARHPRHPLVQLCRTTELAWLIWALLQSKVTLATVSVSILYLQLQP